jgi:hypothetical protein
MLGLACLQLLFEKVDDLARTRMALLGGETLHNFKFMLNIVDFVLNGRYLVPDLDHDLCLLSSGYHWFTRHRRRMRAKIVSTIVLVADLSLSDYQGTSGITNGSTGFFWDCDRSTAS